MIKLENNTLNVISELIYKKSGIKIDKSRKEWLIRRIEKRLDELSLQNINKYINRLLYDITGEEIQNLIEIITINETYFFRNMPQLEIFKDIVLEKIFKEKKLKNLKIWSAGCSIGCEPYTIAIILKEKLKSNFKDWNIIIEATDIDRTALKKAEEGIYNKREVQYVEDILLKKYFEIKDNNYIIRDEIKNMVKFKLSNLNNEKDNEKMMIYDVIFCRNVLIYFDDEIQKKIVKMFYEHLNSPGYIFLGHSESLSRLSRLYTLQRVDDKLFYMKE